MRGLGINQELNLFLCSTHFYTILYIFYIIFIYCILLYSIVYSIAFYCILLSNFQTLSEFLQVTATLEPPNGLSTFDANLQWKSRKVGLWQVLVRTILEERDFAQILFLQQDEVSTQRFPEEIVGQMSIVGNSTHKPPRSLQEHAHD